MRRFNLGSLAGGLGLVVIGLFLLLDSTGSVDLSPGWMASLWLTGAGAGLLASGLGDRD